MTTPNPYIHSLSVSIALCLTTPIAIYAGSRRQLKKHIQRASSPAIDVDPGPEVDSLSSESGSPIPRSRWVIGLKMAAFTVVSLSVAVGLGIGLPLLATSNILDIFWLMFITLQIGMIFRSAINSALPDPRVLDVKWTAWNSVTWTVSGPAPKSPAPNTWRRLALASLLTVWCIGGIYQGHAWLMCLPLSAMVYDFVGSTMVPNQPVRKMVKGIMYVQVALAAFVGSGVGLTALWKHYISSSDDSKQSNFAQPSPEVVSLMTMFQKVIPLIVSGFFIALALRFDYAQGSKTESLVSSTIKPSPHTISIPSFPRPTFKAAMKAFILQQIVFALAYHMPIRSELKDVLMISEALCLTVWPVIWGIVVQAQRSDLYQELMDHSESSANTASTDQVVTGEEDLEEDVEKAEQSPEPSRCVLTFFPGANSSTSSPAL